MKHFMRLIPLFCAIALLLTSCKSEDVFIDYFESESFNTSEIIVDLTDTAEIIKMTDGTELVDYKHTVNPGEQTSLTIKSEPFIEYRIEVEYASGVSQSKQLTPKSADHNGYVTWNWQVGTKCRPGKYPVRIYKVNEQIFETWLNIQ